MPRNNLIKQPCCARKRYLEIYPSSSQNTKPIAALRTCSRIRYTMSNFFISCKILNIFLWEGRIRYAESPPYLRHPWGDLTTEFQRTHTTATISTHGKLESANVYSRTPARERYCVRKTHFRLQIMGIIPVAHQPRKSSTSASRYHSWQWHKLGRPYDQQCEDIRRTKPRPRNDW